MNIAAIASLPPTTRLYNQDPYMEETNATVLYTEGNIAVFDQTIFYAESGGQTSDIGWVDDNEVIDVQKRLGEFFSVKNEKANVSGVKVNTRIIHTFNNDVNFKPGDNVKMRINWDRRYKIMKHHTLSHFLFHAFNTILNQYHVDIFLKGCSINEERASFSLTNKVTDEQLGEIKELIKKIYSNNLPISMLPEETTDEVFYWTVDDIVIPCGGTHIKNTSEITENIYVGKKSGGKNKTKIYIKLEE